MNGKICVGFKLPRVASVVDDRLCASVQGCARLDSLFARFKRVERILVASQVPAPSAPRGADQTVYLYDRLAQEEREWAAAVAKHGDVNPNSLMELADVFYFTYHLILPCRSLCVIARLDGMELGQTHFLALDSLLKAINVLTDEDFDYFLTLAALKWGKTQFVEVHYE